MAANKIMLFSINRLSSFYLKLASLETLFISSCLYHCYAAVVNPSAIFPEQCLKMAVFPNESVQHQVLNVANCTARQGQMRRNILLSVLKDRSVSSYMLGKNLEEGCTSVLKIKP